jgi:hypothetical protein
MRTGSNARIPVASSRVGLCVVVVGQAFGGFLERLCSGGFLGVLFTLRAHDERRFIYTAKLYLHWVRLT